MCLQNSGDVVLNTVCAPAYLDIATELVKGGANVNFQNANDGSSALFWAVNCGNIGLVKLLLEQGADVNMQTLPTMGWASFTPLHVAVARDRSEEALLLIEAGADLSIRSAHGRTPGEMAVERGIIAMIKLFPAQED